MQKACVLPIRPPHPVNLNRRNAPNQSINQVCICYSSWLTGGNFNRRQLVGVPHIVVPCHPLSQPHIPTHTISAYSHGVIPSESLQTMTINASPVGHGQGHSGDNTKRLLLRGKRDWKTGRVRLIWVWWLLFMFFLFAKLLAFYILAMSKVISGWVPTCDSALSWRLYSAVPTGRRGHQQNDLIYHSMVLPWHWVTLS